eukprot:CAMPEP_0172597974 /NCGR_PEP_ID=MMETSP1068-20121228/17960_1 /TAXON_ID=35684 /ORGANISM="Pseudopedinella elastica, Strain CCMP716" /LENGTH=288 /DNA_ID=CAMNT_0013397655 /DNA_START=75 /DNA_END=941 /DNA_ORIENTATION=-
MAVCNDSVEVVKTLLEAGSPVNAKTNPAMSTPLHLCYDKPSMVELLVEAGAAIESPNKWQKTPLDLAQGAHNSEFGPAGEAARLMDEALDDLEATLKRAKAQQMRIDERRKKAAKSQALADAEEAARKAEAEAFLAAQLAEAEEAEEEEPVEGAVPTLTALTEIKGPVYAKALYGGAKGSKQLEIGGARREIDQVQKRQEQLKTDRGLKFEKFVIGKHGGREVDKGALERHAQAKEKQLREGFEDDSEGEEQGEDSEGDDEEEDDEEGNDSKTQYSSLTGGEGPAELL